MQLTAVKKNYIKSVGKVKGIFFSLNQHHRNNTVADWSMFLFWLQQVKAFLMRKYRTPSQFEKS